MGITGSHSAVGRIAQSVASQTAYPGVASSILAWSYTFVEIDYEIISTVILFITLIQEGLLSVQLQHEKKKPAMIGCFADKCHCALF